MYSDQLDFLTIRRYVCVMPLSSCTEMGLLEIIKKSTVKHTNLYHEDLITCFDPTGPSSGLRY